MQTNLSNEVVMSHHKTCRLKCRVLRSEAPNRIVALGAQKTLKKQMQELPTRHWTRATSSCREPLAIHHLQEESGDGTDTSKTSTNVEGVGSTSVGGWGNWVGG